MKYLNPESLFKISFAICFILGINLTLDYTEGIGHYLPYNLTVWIFISFWTGLGLWKIHNKKIIRISVFSKFLLLGVFFLFLPFFYQKNIPYDLIYIRYIGIISITGLYLTLQQFDFHKNDTHFFYFIIILSTLLKSSFELFIYFFPNLFINTNIDIYLFNTINHRNVQSTFLILGPLLSLFIILNTKKEIFKISFKEIILFSTTFLISIILILLQSKTAIIAYPISILLIFLGRYTFNKNVIIWFLLTFSGFIIGHYLKENYSEHTRFIKRSDISNQNSFKVRLNLYTLSLELWNKKPFTGHGYGTFLSVFRNHYAVQKEKKPNIIDLGSKNVLHPHNEILFWLVEGGIIPLIGLLIIAGSFIILLWKIKIVKPLSLIGCIFPIIFHTQVEYPFYNSAIHLFIFCFFIYQIDQKYGKYTQFKNRFSFIPKLLSFIVPLISIIYLITILQTIYVITKYEKTGQKNINLLKSALNPSALKIKYDNYLLKSYLNNAIKTKNTQKLKTYITIVEKKIKYTPFLFLYYDLSTAYKNLGETEKMLEYSQKGNYLYQKSQ